MKILVGVDASSYSTAVLERAIELARALGASLEVVHVFEMPFVYDLGAAVNVEQVRQAEAEAVWSVAQPVIDDAGDLDITRTDLMGGAARVLVARAKDTSVDLIVVGNRGRGDLASLVLGSTSHGVIHTAPCDVFIVKGD
ncbi:MAG TPA: universal stress protein [Acidimicrobiia bacterium]|jgi:nucleotide-binding universal stress UspA family protein